MCHTLGLFNGKATNSTKFEKFKNEASALFVNCIGMEVMNSILDCTVSSNIRRTCVYGKGAGATCFSIDKHCSRLIFDDQIICSNGNDFATSQVICKWAGYSTGKHVRINSKLFYQNYF